MNFLVIAGHGAGDPGAVSGGKCEADLAREFAELLQSELLKYYCNCDVFNTKYSAYHEIVTLNKNYDFKPYDYVLELHFNAHTENEDGKVKGSEIYVTTGTSKITLEKKILEKLSQRGFTNRGVKHKNFSLITKIKEQGKPCSLLELCFIDDKDDMRLYSRNKAEIAAAVALAFAEECNLKNRANPTFPDVDNHWARADIEKVAKAGYILGYRDGNFKPDKYITRAELATVIGRMLP